MKHLSTRSLNALAPFALGITLAACSANADEDGVSASAPGVSAQADKDGASASAGPVDVATAQQALTELTSGVDVSVDGFKTGSPAAGAAGSASASAAASGGDGNATQTINVACAAGGDADVDGYVNVVPIPVAVDVKVGIDFNACATRTGSVVDGNIDFSQSVVTGLDTPLQIETLYQGDVTHTGKVNVTCPVDLNVLVDETGRAVKVAGMFCNQDASALNLQVQPRWQAAK